MELISTDSFIPFILFINSLALSLLSSFLFPFILPSFSPPSFLPVSLPHFLPSFLLSLPPSFLLPSFLPSLPPPPSFLPSFLPCSFHPFTTHLSIGPLSTSFLLTSAPLIYIGFKTLLPNTQILIWRHGPDRTRTYHKSLEFGSILRQVKGSRNIFMAFMQPHHGRFVR